MRVRYGFENCFLTDVVKCGVRRGGRHTDAELDACGDFLARELDLVRPMVAVGNNAMFALRRVARRMKDPPVLFQITHYSARGNKAEREWPHEMAELRRLLELLRPRSGRPQCTAPAKVTRMKAT